METYRYFEEQRMLMECLVKGGGGRKNLENMEMMRSVCGVCLIMKNSDKESLDIKIKNEGRVNGLF